LKWKDDIHNLVTTVGKNFTMDTTLGNTAGGAVVMGLKGVGTAAVGDTQASHATWLEVGLANAPTYTGNRPTPTFSAAAAGAKTTSSAVTFAITGSGTVAGCFINIGGLATKDNTTGTLFSAGDFTAGSKTVTSGDTLSVTYTATAA
jgi:formate/nitrite transporter FocA (FNT family)